MTRAICIEFLGLPGSGKSMLVERLLPQLRFLGWRVLTYRDVMVPMPGQRYRKIRLSCYFLKFWMARLPSLWRVLRLFFSARPLRRIRFYQLNRLLKEACLIHRARMGNDGALLVLDQGLLQAIWAILFYSEDFDQRALKSVLTASDDDCGPDVLVMVEDTPERVAPRMRSRKLGDCPLDDLDESVILDVLRPLMTTMYGTLPEHIATLSRPVLRVDPSAQDGDIVELLRQALPSPPSEVVISPSM